MSGIHTGHVPLYLMKSYHPWPLRNWLFFFNKFSCHWWPLVLMACVGQQYEESKRMDALFYACTMPSDATSLPVNLCGTYQNTQNAISRSLIDYNEIIRNKARG